MSFVTVPRPRPGLAYRYLVEPRVLLSRRAAGARPVTRVQHALSRRHPLPARARQRHPVDGDLPRAGAPRSRRAPDRARLTPSSRARDPYVFYGLPRHRRLHHRARPGVRSARSRGASATWRSRSAARSARAGPTSSSRAISASRRSCCGCRRSVGRRWSTNRTAMRRRSLPRCPRSSPTATPPSRRQAAAARAQRGCGVARRGRLRHDHARPGRRSGAPARPAPAAGGGAGRRASRCACLARRPRRSSMQPPPARRLCRAPLCLEGRRRAARRARRAAGGRRADRGRTRTGAGPRARQGAGGEARSGRTGRASPGWSPPPTVRAQLARADVLVLPNPASAISSRFTSPLKLFEYMAAGRPIVASDLPAMREILTADVNAVLVAPGSAAGAGRRHPPGPRRTPGCRDGWRPRRRLRRRTTRWDRRAERLEALLADVRGRRAVISDRLLALVRCPECRAPLTRDRRSRHLQRLRAPLPRGRQRLSRPAADRSSSRSRPSTWTRRCTPMRATSGSRRRCSARRIRNDMLRALPRARPAPIASSIWAAAAAARCCGTPTGARRRSASTSARTSRRRRAPASICCSAICAGCRSRTAPSPRRTRSTCSSTCRRRRCAAC